MYQYLNELNLVESIPESAVLCLNDSAVVQSAVKLAHTFSVECANVEGLTSTKQRNDENATIQKLRQSRAKAKQNENENKKLRRAIQRRRIAKHKQKNK